eukprot:SAG22_NODE_11784_length_469_cov_0.972973_1_plen_132_part_10
MPGEGSPPGSSGSSGGSDEEEGGNELVGQHVLEQHVLEAFDAAAAGDAPAIERLLGALGTRTRWVPVGADLLVATAVMVTATDETGRTLAHEAAFNGHAAVISALGRWDHGHAISVQAFCGAEDELGWTPCH